MARNNFLESLFYELSRPPMVRPQFQSLYAVPVKLEEMIEPQFLEHEKLYNLCLNWSISVWCKDEISVKNARNEAKKEWYQLVYGDLQDLVRELVFLSKHGSQHDMQIVSEIIYKRVFGLE